MIIISITIENWTNLTLKSLNAPNATGSLAISMFSSKNFFKKGGKILGIYNPPKVSTHMYINKIREWYKIGPIQRKSTKWI